MFFPAGSYQPSDHLNPLAGFERPLQGAKKRGKRKKGKGRKGRGKQPQINLRHNW